LAGRPYYNTNGSYYDPEFLTGLLTRSKTARNGYHNPRVDELLDAAASTLDEQGRKARYAEVFEILAQDVPHFWIAEPVDLWVTTSKVRLPDRKAAVLQFDAAKDRERVG
jgi:ABC-type transport system substrate-binding protein